MKKLLSLVLCLIMCFSFVVSTNVAFVQAQEPDFSKTARELCDDITVGWNLGNTLEAYNSWSTGSLLNGVDVSKQETAWANPITTKRMIDYVKKSGFNAVRIPVTWGTQTTEKNGVYTIKPEMISRVREVVSYCLQNDMYAIVNMHHDDRMWLGLSGSEDQFEQVKEQYRQMWTQIAEAFEDYDQRLILEGNNETLAICAYDGCSTSTGYCWWGHSDESFLRLYEINQIFYDAVRNGNGYNAQRYIMIPTYGAQWYEHQLNKIYNVVLDDHTIIDIHWYGASNTSLTENTPEMNSWKKWLDAKFHEGVGLVLGETAPNGYKNLSSANRIKWVNNFVKPLKQDYGIPVFIWDDGGDFKHLERDSLFWTDYNYIQALATATQKPTEDGEGDDTGDEPVIVPPRPGDLTLDGNINGLDVLRYQKYLAKTRLDTVVTTDNADLNSDGLFTATDVYLLRKMVLSLYS